ncbi:MAG: hypothetical protein M3Y36_00105 [Actinomycetota bacterium]|nr:hypothetical protein [Actinomycetota bacterium]
MVCDQPRKVLVAAATFVVVGLVVGDAATSRLSSGESDYLPPSSSVATAYHQVQRATGADQQEGYVLLVRLPGQVEPGAAPPLVVADVARVLRAQRGVLSVADY